MGWGVRRTLTGETHIKKKGGFLPKKRREITRPVSSIGSTLKLWESQSHGKTRFVS